MARHFCTVGTIKKWEMIEDKDYRPVHVRQSVFEAVTAWKSSQGTAEGYRNGDNDPPVETILQSIPRRKQSVPPDERKLWIPVVEPAAINIPFGRSLRRLLTWL